VTAPGRVHRVDLDGFRQAMGQDPALSDVLLRALLTRRERLRDGPAKDALQIVGAELSAAGLALRTYAARQLLPHRWLDVADPAAAELLAAAGLAPAELPAVVLLDCAGLFCSIGATPSTSWLPEPDLDEDGFVRTDVQLDRWAEPGRGPLPYETSVPRVFAVGDVRVGSMKRVAAAGEGASAIPSLHAALAAVAP